MVTNGICNNNLWWLQIYLCQISLIDLFGGIHTSSRNVINSVKQGSSFSPSLFKLVNIDMLRVAEVYRSEFADEFATAATCFEPE